MIEWFQKQGCKGCDNQVKYPYNYCSACLTDISHLKEEQWRWE